MLRSELDREAVFDRLVSLMRSRSLLHCARPSHAHFLLAPWASEIGRRWISSTPFDYHRSRNDRDRGSELQKNAGAKMRVAMSLIGILILACASASNRTSGVPEATSVQSTPPPASGGTGIDTLDTRMLAQPAVSHDHIAFVYAGDLWVARLDGSGVRRLTTHPGIETRPRFSPDGQWIAFTGEYDGNLDVYIVSVDGGEPKRLTWHPREDVVQDFTPDGKAILFTSMRALHTNRFRQLFSVPVAGGVETELPLPSCAKASISPDGKKIAYLPLLEAFGQWKNYRGGRASRIWIYDVGDRSVVQVPQPDGRCNDTDPMWIGEKLYFRSDRAGEFNLFAYDRGTKKVEQLTRYDDFPIQNASAGGGKIAFEQAGWLYLFDPAGAKSERLRVGVSADLVDTRPRFVKGEQYIRSAGISPSGSRAVFGFRGEIVTVPAEKGDPRNLTNTVGANERDPAWSPDGKSIAYFSDASGENQLVVAPQSGHGDTKTFALGGAGFYEDPKWSPDGKKLSFIDNARTLSWIDLDSGKVTRVDQEPIYGVLPSLHHAWSGDSRWIAYTRMERSNFKRVYLYDVASATSHPITEGLSDASEPVFDANGKYLWLAASTDAGPINTWFAQSSAEAGLTNSLYLIVLAKDTPSPFAKESDEEKGKAEDKKEGDGGKAPDKKDGEEKKNEGEKKSEGEKKESENKPAEVKIDLDGLEQRIVAVPIPVALYTSLTPGADGQLLYLKSERGTTSGPGPTSALCRFDSKKREEKSLQEGVRGFSLAANHEKVLLRTERGWWIVSATGDKIDTSKGKLAIDSIQVKIEPRAEWAQIFDETWRINRDYFYDPGMQGADWPAMKKKYAQFLPHLAVRSDLGRVIQWLCSELAVGHSFSGGGDTLVKIDEVPGGLLGADYEVADGRYRFKKVFGGLNWTPDLRAPLTEPGVDVKTGEYLLAVEGRDLRPPENLYSRFENTAGKIVELTVGPNADGSGSRTVKVVPIADEMSLRNRDWIEGNIRKVTEATNGRVAYVYVPNTAEAGFTYFKRYFFPQARREAIIVDERYNGGGDVADYYIDILRRPYVANWATRYGEDLATPQAAILGPKVMLIDETAGSGGDLLPWMFRKFKLGTLVGRRTWGGLVGILGFPELMDGGSVTAPNIAFWTSEEGFGVENVGVPPDIEVEQLPAEVSAGHDPQLEKAIEVAMEQLAKNPPTKPTRPPYPVRVRK
jgi:tricorn protease